MRRKKQNCQSPKDTFENNGKGCGKRKCNEKQQRAISKKANRFPKIDDFWKSLIRQTIYGFYQNKIVPTLGMLLSKFKEISARTDYEFPYGRTRWQIIESRLSESHHGKSKISCLNVQALDQNPEVNKLRSNLV